jgi:tryptophanase
LAKLNNDICNAVRVFAYSIIAPISKLRAAENLLPFNLIHLTQMVAAEQKSLLVNNFHESGRLFLISSFASAAVSLFS